MKQIKKKPCPKDEQETVIVIDPNAKTADIYSSASPMINRMRKLLDHPDAKLDYEDQYGLEIVVPMSWIKIRPPIVRTYTEEQRQAMAERLRTAREKHNVAV